MSWRDNLREARFRGVPFLYTEAEKEGGRRVAVHEYPLRDRPFTEDLGRRARRYTIESHVLGPDYMARRDALRDALEAEGPGLLIHPYHGELQVAVERFELRESTRRGGMAEFRITFVEAGPAVQPTLAADTAAGVERAAESAVAAVEADFVERFEMAGLPPTMLEELDTELERITRGLERLAPPTSGLSAADLLGQPGELARQITGTMRRLTQSLTTGQRLVETWGNLLGRSAIDNGPTFRETTPRRRQQARSAEALRRLVARNEAVEAARATAEIDFETREDAIAHRDTVSDALEREASATDSRGRPIDDPVFHELRTLRAAVVADVRERGARLASLDRYTPPATLPALVVAHQAYGDARREGQIIRRNAFIHHPGFVPGGSPLEVIRD